MFRYFNLANNFHIFRFEIKTITLVKKTFFKFIGLLKEIYEDKDGQRREEVAKLSGPNEFAEFYERLKGIKEFHRRHPGESISVPMSVEFEELKKAREGNDDTIMAEFTDEEGISHICLLFRQKSISNIDQFL